MDKEFLTYLIRSKKHLSLFLLIGGLLPTCFYLLYPYSLPETSMTIVMIWMSFIAIMEALVLPFIYYSYLHSKRALDSYFSLPVDKTKILITNYIHLVGQIILFAIVGTVLPFLLSFRYIRIESYFSSMGILILLILAISLIVIAIIHKTNSTIDSIVITLAYIVLPFLIYVVISIFMANNIFATRTTTTFLIYGTVVAFLNPLWVNIESIIHGTLSSYDSILLLEIFAVIIVSGASILYDNHKRKSEYAETVSRNFFAYPLVIGLTTMCLCLLAGFAWTNILLVILVYITIFVGYLIMNFIYRRKIQIIRRDLLLFLTAIITSFIIIVGSEATDGFGLNVSYRNINEARFVYISVYYYDYNEGNQYDYQAVALVLDDPEAIEALIAYEDILYEDFKNDEDEFYDFGGYWVQIEYRSNDKGYYINRYEDGSGKRALQRLLSYFEDYTIYYYGDSTDYILYEATIEEFIAAMGD